MPQRDTSLAPAQHVLSVVDLKTHFFTDAGVIKAVNGVTLSVDEGETLAIVGESGSGKSVTGLTVMRLLGRTTAKVVGGSIHFRGRNEENTDLLALSEKAMSRIRGHDIAMIFQDPMSSLNPVFTVGDQVAESLRVHKGLSKRGARLQAIELLRQVGISEPEKRVDAYPHELSGGMRQRVMIAVALACDPRLLIADEPTTALDVTIQAQIIDLLRKLQKELRMALIFVTHDLKLVKQIADHVAVMYASQVVEEGPVDQVLANPRHPYTRALLDCIPSRRDGDGNRRTLKPIPGTMPNPLSPPDGCRFHARCAYAQPECVAIEPELQVVEGKHVTRCIRWQELAL
ncbi:oligopeptide/dipeptide ABC transporter ATP-binding protein [Devosia subaequoris]|uniref:Nickel import system ATP-binding protein NikD n=1 Tax=Devosia subaequoris TaxID=395930 RepID=A0A7W6IQI5_9HYPH|nr:ABC transporter ATP-binding protein [Devosia subaequoris]MBB4053956.1 oligopeptide/dipeptide ABC transporter ATP-binding protein [Devosia subaequoris]MCP1211460.1 ABC transporter ATP-binding protein [Devosia subaequoris]